WEFCLAGNEFEALQKVRDQLQAGRPVDMIITDLDMTDERGGITLIKEVQKLDPTVMTILYTGKKEILDRCDMSGLGALDVVVKAPHGQIEMERILEKTRLALRYRSWAVRIGFLRRY